MNKKPYSSRPGRPGSRPKSAPVSRHITRVPRPPRPISQDKQEKEEAAPLFEVIDRTAIAEARAKLPFRILIAVHRPRFRGRAERAAAREGWSVTALLNKQDVVGQISKQPYPPEIVVLSHDFGRQRDLAIFRAIQKWRSQGMILVGLMEDCETAPETRPDSVPSQLCDVCLTPPIKASDFNALFAELYVALKDTPAPPMKRAALGAAGETDEIEDEDED